MEKLSIGGQAVIEGVLIRGPNHYSIAVRKPDKSISVKREKISGAKKLRKVFFIRGILALWETLNIGFKAIIHSANEAAGEDEKLGKKEVFLTVAVSIIFALLLFVALPFYLSTLVTEDKSFIFNLVDGILRAAVFLVYLIAISFFPDVKRMFQYHGAEHMAIHCYEAGKKISVREVRKFETMHPRCGTSFLLFVLLLSVVVFSLITSESWLIRFGSRIILLPAIAGLSYELLKFSDKHRKNFFFSIVVFPGLMLQKITTKRPSDDQIEVAIASIHDLLKAEKEGKA